MRINLNIFLVAMGVSFCANISSAQTWYDSEGRELIIDGKKVTRKEVDKSAEKSDEKKKPERVELEKKVVSPIIPQALELRPELSTVPSRKVYQVFHPYSNFGYGHYGYYGRPNYHHYSPYNQGCYQGGGILRNNFYLDYRRGGLRIQTRF
jgi:hypothetical protein